MHLFTSAREKRFWLYALLVWVTIFSTLVLRPPLQKLLGNQNIQAVFFIFGMAMIGATILIHGLKVRPSKIELVIWFGLAAVFIMFIYRLGATERSHLIEYGTLSIFIHKAFVERLKHKSNFLKPALLSIVITVLIGVLDESIQIFLPNRVFDPLDMVFNSLSAILAISASILLQWVRRKFRNKT